MKTLIIPFARRFCTLTGVSCHCASNVEFTYHTLGFNVHALPTTVAIVFIYVLVALKQFGILKVRSRGAEITLEVAEFLLQALVLVPLFLTPKGEFMDLNNTNGLFWTNVVVISGGIILLRVLTFIFDNSSIESK